MTIAFSLIGIRSIIFSFFHILKVKKLYQEGHFSNGRITGFQRVGVGDADGADELNPIVENDYNQNTYTFISYIQKGILDRYIKDEQVEVIFDPLNIMKTAEINDRKMLMASAYINLIFGISCIFGLCIYYFIVK